MVWLFWKWVSKLISVEKERYKIEGWLESGKSETEIAKFLGKHKRTIKREIAKGKVEQRDSL